MSTVQESAMQIVMDLTDLLPAALNHLSTDNFEKICAARSRAATIAGFKPEKHIIAGYRSECERAIADIAQRFSSVQDIGSLLDDELCNLAFTAEHFARLVDTYMTQKRQYPVEESL